MPPYYVATAQRLWHAFLLLFLFADCVTGMPAGPGEFLAVRKALTEVACPFDDKTLL